MGNVYRYGWCNIAAAEAKDTKSGLFVDRDDNEVDAIIPKVFKVAPKSLIGRAKSALWDNIHGVLYTTREELHQVGCPQVAGLPSKRASGIATSQDQLLFRGAGFCKNVFLL